MIERNLGNIERLVRLLAGVGFLIWSATGPGLNGIEWFVGLIAAGLMLNGIFSRCYLWYLLDINTCRDASDNCRPEPGCY